MSEYDAIIIGAGHNGLILAAYLGKAGLRTLLIDRRHIAGGGLSTMEDPRHPGFLHNTHAFFQRAITAMPWFADLELERHGAHYIEPELNVALLTSDGRALEWWTDIDRTIESFSGFSKRDAETLRRWQQEFVPIVQNILAPESRSPPLPEEERRALLSRSAAGRYLLEVSALSPLEFVHREFEHPTVQAGLLFFNGLREVDLRVRGFGHQSRPCWQARPRRRCRAAERPHWPARSKRPCKKAAVRFVCSPNQNGLWSKTARPSASKQLMEKSCAPVSLSRRRSIRSRLFSICSAKTSCRATFGTRPRRFNTTCSLRFLRLI
jgi:hypothetical protein